MTPFWTSFFDHLKDCGRNAAIFLVTLAVLFGLLILVGLLNETQLRDYGGWILGTIFTAGMIWAGVTIHRARKRSLERINRSPLSDDELFKARCKLGRTRR